MIPQDVLDQLALTDEECNLITSRIDHAQSLFFGTNSRYWQGICTHSSTPSVASPLNPVRSKHATDCVSWTDAGISLPYDMVCSYQVDAYNGEDGLGYVIIIRTMIENQEYQKKIVRGAEKDRENFWEKSFERII